MKGELRNIIRFSFAGGKITLLLENEFVLTAGMQPNVNAFLCSYKDFALFNDKPGVDGSIEFWSTGKVDEDGTETGDPDFVFERCTIVDAQIAQYGSANVDQGLQRVLVWRLMIADRRHNLIAPRGGVVTKGEMNKTPFSKQILGGGVLGPEAILDANKKRLYTARELVQICIDKMGLHDEVQLPQLLSDANAPNDLDWRGNHAPTELEKILTEAGFIFTIDEGGRYSIVNKNAGDVPVFPGDAVKLPVPGIDRRGKIVVFSSFPLPILDTLDLSGPADYNFPDPDKDELEYCFFDPGDQRPGHAATSSARWITLLEASQTLFNGRDPAQMITFGYDPRVEAIGSFGAFGDVKRSVDPSWMSVAITSLFRTVRINPRNKKWGPTPILQDVFLKGDNWIGKPSLWAIHPLKATTGEYNNSKDKVRINIVNLLDQGKVLVVWDRLMKVKKPFDDGGVIPVPPADEQPFHSGIFDLDPWLVPLSPGDLELSATFEAKKLNRDNEWEPEFFYVGYQYTLAGLVQLKDDETQLAIQSPDTVIVSRPDMVLHRINGEDQNRKALTDQAANLAPQYIRGSDSPSAQWHVRGFKRYVPTGIVSKVTITQSPPVTMVEVNTWFLPHGIYLTREKELKNTGEGGTGGSEKHPNQTATAVDRMAQGQTGAALNSLPIAPFPPIPNGSPPHGVCRIDFRTSAGGGVPTGGAKYMGFIINGATTIGPSGQFKMLDGMTLGSACLIINFAEVNTPPGAADGAGSNWAIISTQAPTYANYEFLGITANTGIGGADGLPIVGVSIANPHSLFPLVLSKDGGADGGAAAAASWTYTCKTLANDTLGTARTPEMGRPTGPAQQATRGIGYFDAERNFKLLYAHEVHGTGSCVPA